MKFFLLILPLLQSIWSFHFSIVEAISDPPLSSISAPLSSPPIGATSPISSSMAAFSPGIHASLYHIHWCFFICLVTYIWFLGSVMGSSFQNSNFKISRTQVIKFNAFNALNIKNKNFPVTRLIFFSFPRSVSLSLIFNLVLNLVCGFINGIIANLLNLSSESMYLHVWSAIQEGSEENQMDSHKKTFIALTVASAALGVTILILLSLWIHKKCSQKSHKSNAQSSGIFFSSNILFIS